MNPPPMQSFSESNRDDQEELIRAVEPYTHFLATEQQLIKPHDKQYRRFRQAYIDTLYLSPNHQHPGTELEHLMAELLSNHYLETTQAQSFCDAAWLLGMELITDRPSFRVAEDGLLVYRGIPFAEYNHYQLKLDLYLPQRRNRYTPSPVILCIHGGGFRVHRRASENGFAAYFAQHGFAAISIDYRMRPGLVTYLEPIEDAKAAVRWIYANAQKFNFDTTRIGAVGGSAGALLSALLATTAHRRDLEGNGGNPQYPSQIHAAVCFAVNAHREPAVGIPGTEYEHLRKEDISPYWNASPAAAPMYLLHGTADEINSYHESTILHQRLLAAGSDSRLELLEGLPHVFFNNPAIARKAFDFFHEIFFSHPQDG
ncbi:MAG: alpha/beta hydrolase [Lentisphaerae bacterium]|nr:MAG: alpha/beta hydrolase [Lentisphaerota bacterium]